MKFLSKKIAFAVCFLCAIFCVCPACGNEGAADTDYPIKENNYFLVMRNMLYFPENYLGAKIDLDCFVYEIEDVVTGETFVCGVRKCPANIGCKCGNDSILGFILVYDGEIPPAVNQTGNDNNKAWIHLTGGLDGTEMTAVNVYGYGKDGLPTDTVEQIYFLRFAVESLRSIDGSGLNYYVD